jgi:tetratricopeptide (TPR) repeat protein
MYQNADVRNQTKPAQATNLRPVLSDANDWYLQGDEFEKRGNLAEAKKCYDKAIDLKPDFADAHVRLGRIVAQQGQPAKVIDHFRQALRLRPDDHDTLCGLALLLAGQGQVEEAVVHWRTALRLQPDSAQAHHNLAVALAQQGKTEEAAEAFRRAIQYRPRYSEALFNLGTLLLQQRKPAEAADAFRSAVRLKPDYFDGYNNLGFALIEQGKPTEAVVFLQHAVRLRPQSPEAQNNLGLALAEADRFAEAEARFQEALRLAPGHIEAHDNLASTYRKQGRLDEAAACYDLALWLKPESPATRWNRSLLLLQTGKFQEGWTEYEWRWRRSKAPVFGGRPRSFGRPLWDGSPLAGRRILLHMEQGLGDMIQFVRYAEILKSRGADVIVECPPFLVPLFATCPGIDHLVAEASNLPDFDVHCPLMTLPRLLNTTMETIPAKVPYLFADDDLTERWRQRLDEFDGFKIGVAWQGNPKHRWDRYRSVSLAQFAPLARLEGVRVLSLQKGSGAEQLRLLGAGLSVVELGDEREPGPKTFMDTAAIMKNLDLVITVDTAVAHLAGALGRPVWVVLSTIADWRWFDGRADSPWYPSMRLFRQTTLGDWDSVFARMADEIRLLITKTRRYESQKPDRLQK